MALQTTLDTWAPRILSVVRIVVALLFIQHGLQKLFSFPGPGPTGDGPLPPILLIGAWLEFVGGALVAIGLFTRPVAFILSGEMAVGYFMFHAPRGFYPALNGGDAAILFSFIFLYFAFAGGGAWGVDALKSRRKTEAAAG